MSQTGTYNWNLGWLTPPRNSKQPRKRRRGEHTERLTRTVSTTPFRIPRLDWGAITNGDKTEFRRHGKWGYETYGITPRPIVIYSVHDLTEEYEVDVAILEDIWQEPLGVITPESLANEGYRNVREFRSYFQERYPRRGWRPLDKVWVYKLRPFTPADRREHADKLFRELFGSWL